MGHIATGLQSDTVECCTVSHIAVALQSDVDGLVEEVSISSTIPPAQPAATGHVKRLPSSTAEQHAGELFLDCVLALCTSAWSFAQPAATKCFKHLPSSAADEHAGVLYVPCPTAVCAALLVDVQAQLHPCKTAVHLTPCWHESVCAKLIMTHL